MKPSQKSQSTFPGLAFVVALVLSVLASVCIAAQPAPERKPNAEPTEKKPALFQEKGLFSIASPAEGFSWQKIRSVTQKDATGKEVSAYVYSCTKSGGTDNLVLTVELRDSKIDPIRVAALKGGFNGMYKSLEQGGFKFLSTKRPDIKTPVPDEVPFSIHAQSPDGKEIFLQSVVVFGKEGKNIYTLSAFTSNRETSRKLFDAAKKSFRETPDKTEKR